ncbi:MAG: hypothetical protein ACUVUC_07180 [Thermoguttaceae bacterium]
MPRVLLNSLAFLAILGIMAGCGKARSKHPPTYPTTATVTYKGKPVEGARVDFHPTDLKKGVTASGLTGPDGVAKLRTPFAEGAVAGSYLVTIDKTEGPAAQPSAVTPTGGPPSPEDYAKALSQAPGYTAKAAGPVGPPKSLLPEKYRNKDTSGFKAEVRAGETNQFTFPLE